MSNSTITVRDLAELRRMVGEQARLCIHEPRGFLPFHFVTPTFGIEPGADETAPVSARSLYGGLYQHAYDWDSMLFTEAFGRLLGTKWLLLAQVKNFLANQREDGFVPRTISPGRIFDEGDCCKPFMSQTLYAALTRQDITLEDVAPLLGPIQKLLDYYRCQRWHPVFGLYHWKNVLESGIDCNLALLFPREAQHSENVDGSPVVDYPDGRLLATDLNAYMFAELLAFSRLCALCGDHKRAGHYEQLSADLQQKIETTLWSEELDMYANFDPLTGESVKIRSWSGLAPALFGVSSDERARRVITQNILSEQHFLRPCGIASLAASEHMHNQAPRALYGRAYVCNWSGPIWILPNALVARLLVACDFIKEACDLAARVLRPVINDLFTSGIMHENYDSENGAPRWGRQFVSWNILVLELATLLERSLEATPPLVSA